MALLDFSSALYLGLRHPSSSLRPWRSLTLGASAALVEPEGAAETAAALAVLQGCEQGVLSSSSLHLFWDLFRTLTRSPTLFLLDSQSYPIAHWAARAAAVNGATPRTFRHFDPDALGGVLALGRRTRVRPVVITDGYCPDCGAMAPLPDYLPLIRRYGGLIIVDDTQALGVLGGDANTASPYGTGGGGILRWDRISDPCVAVAASLAKGFGAPLAVLSGEKNLIRSVMQNSGTRLHCSPPATAAIRAAERALEINRQGGDQIRKNLLARVRQFQHGIRKLGLISACGLFPIQIIEHPAAPVLQRLLARAGVQCVLIRRRHGQRLALCFLITAAHQPADIAAGLAALAAACNLLNPLDRITENFNVTSQRFIA